MLENFNLICASFHLVCFVSVSLKPSSCYCCKRELLRMLFLDLKNVPLFFFELYNVICNL